MQSGILLDKLTLLLGSEVDSKNAEFALEQAVDTVMNYCNIDAIPKGLENTVVKIAADLYRNNNFGSSDNSSLQSISEGDVSVTFGNAYEATDISSIVSGYSHQLNRYRKVGFC